MVYDVPSRHAVVVEHDDPENLQVDFAVQDHDLAIIGVYGRWVRVIIGGETVFEIGTAPTPEA